MILIKFSSITIFSTKTIDFILLTSILMVFSNSQSLILMKEKNEALFCFGSNKNPLKTEASFKTVVEILKWLELSLRF